MVQSYLLSLCMFFAFLCAIPTPVTSNPTETSAPQAPEKISTTGRAFLAKIKLTIDAALSPINDGLWPRCDMLFKTADQSICMLYLYKEKNKSAIADACMTYLEDFLEQLSHLPSHKLHKNSPEVAAATNKALTNLQTIVADLSYAPREDADESLIHELSPQDQLFLDKSVKFTIFMRTAFMPSFPIHNESTSWFETAQEKVCEVVSEYPFACGVAATATVVAIVWYFTRSKESSGGNGSGGSSQDGWLQMTRFRMEKMKKRPMAEPSSTQQVACAPQGPNQCGYHTAANALTFAKALKGQKPAGQEATKKVILEAQLPTTPEVEAKSTEFKDKKREKLKKRRDAHLKKQKEEVAKLEEIKKQLKEATDTPSETLKAQKLTAEKELKHVADDIMTADVEIADLGRARQIDHGTCTQFNEHLLTFEPTVTDSYAQPTEQFFWHLHDHLQNSDDRETLTGAREVLQKLTSNPTLKQKMQEDLKPYVQKAADGSDEMKWPDEHAFRGTNLSGAELSALRSFKGIHKNISEGAGNAHILSCAAFQAGKPVVAGSLQTDGDPRGGGHWTTLVFIPNDARPPTSAIVIKADSISTQAKDTTSICDTEKRYLHDLINLKPPTNEEVAIVEQLLNPATIAALVVPAPAPV